MAEPIQLTEVDYLRMQLSEQRLLLLNGEMNVLIERIQQARAANDALLKTLGEKYGFDPTARLAGNDQTFQLSVVDAKT